MPFRPALPINRAVFHRLGLSVGIAIALAGCEDATRDMKADRTFREIAGTETLEGAMMRVALADGTVEKTEAAVLIAESRAHGVLASGIETGTAETPQDGSVRSMKARPDAQKPHPSKDSSNEA